MAGLVFLAALVIQSAGQMLEVAAQGGRGKAVLAGQGAVGRAPEKLAVDLRAGGWLQTVQRLFILTVDERR